MKKQFLAAICILFSGIYLLPVFYGYFQETPEKKFLGIAGAYCYDQYYYFSLGASQTYNGNYIFYEDKYDRLDGRRVYLNILGTVQGVIGKILNESNVISFHILRSLAVVGFIIFVLSYSAPLLTQSSARVIAVTLMCFGAGFGWLSMLNLPFSSLDLELPELLGYLSFLGESILPFAWLLVWLFILLFVRTFSEGKKQIGIFLGVSAFFLSIVYIYSYVMCAGVAVVVSLIFDRDIKKSATRLWAVFLLPLPVLLYYAWMYISFSTIQESGWFAGPDVVSVLAALGFPLLIAIIGYLTKILRRKEDKILLAWFLVQLFIFVIPIRGIDFKIQMLLGLQIPVVISASNFMAEIIKQKPFVIKAAVVTLFLVFSSLSTFYFVYQQFEKFSRKEAPYFLVNDEWNAIQWLKENAKPDDVVLSSGRLLAFISGEAGTDMFYYDTHDSSMYLKNKNQQIEQLRTCAFADNDEEFVQWSKQTKIDYIFSTPDLFVNNCGRNFLEAHVDVSKTFSSDSVDIYRLQIP